MPRVDSTVGFGFTALAMVGPGTALARPEVLALDATGDPCGRWAAVVRASGRGQHLVFRAGGDVVAEWEVDGERTFEITGKAPPGSTLRLEAAIRRGRTPFVHELRMAVPDAALGVVPTNLIVTERNEPRFDLAVTTSCDPVDFSWEAQVRQSGAVANGKFLPTATAWFVAPTATPGFYDVDFRLLVGETEITRASVTYEVRGTP